MTEIPNQMINAVLAFVVVIAIVTIIGQQIEEEDNNHIIQSTSCEADTDCTNYIMDCIVHVEEGYQWNNQIHCINEKCVCMSYDTDRMTFNALKKSYSTKTDG